MRSIGFGLERVALWAIRWPLPATILFLALIGALGYGVTQISFNEDLRNVFAGKTRSYEAYQRVTSDFADPENETLVLVEGSDLGTPAVFTRLETLQFELLLIDGVESVYSLFALRGPPDANGDAPLSVDAAGKGLTPELAEAIRNHPILGDKLLTADRSVMVFIVTPTEPKAPLSVARDLKIAIDATAAELLGGSGLAVTVTGFPTIRAAIVVLLENDQVLLNVSGAIIGFVMSLIVFRSLVAAIMTAVPAILGGLAVIGGMGLLGLPINIMTTVVPALVMILGYVDGMHLTYDWRQHRNAGKSVAEAERLAQKEVGAACALAALTTAIAFLSLLIGDIHMVLEFGWVGAVGTMVGSSVVLVAHALLTLAVGRWWKVRTGRVPNLIAFLAGPSAALCRFAVDHARWIGAGSAVLFVAFLVLHYSVPAEHSIREHLPKNDPANAALGRIDQALNGVFPIEIVVPLHGVAPTSPEGLEKIAAVHRAVAAVDGVGSTISLWSLVDWLGGPDVNMSRRVDALIAELPPSSRSRFMGKSDSALVTASVKEQPSYQTEALIGNIEAAATAAGAPDAVVTGVTVVSTREAVRTIADLNLSLTLDVLANLAIIMLAFRSIPTGAVSFLPNIIPILGVGTFLYFLGRGMQMTSVVALTVAFGIAVDNTIHYINRFHFLGARMPLRERLIETSRQIGPVMLGTTLIIITGLTTTLTSGLPNIALFGMITAATLAGALLSSLIILPALLAGYGKRWFESDKVQAGGVEGVRAEAPP
jgi:predicted RND superfamily exporter protein